MKIDSGKTNKKFRINKKTVIIAGIILFCLLAPDLVSAGLIQGPLTLPIAAFNLASKLFGKEVAHIGKAILVDLTTTIHYVLNWIFKAGADFFELILNIGFDKSTVKFIENSWKTVRDISNMFFILFMIIIAFGTILRLPEYGVKKLLPKLIIVALLINFSFVICSVVVDFSNITADFFIKNIKDKIAGGEKGSISAVFSDAFNIAGVYTTYANCKEYGQKLIKECTKFKLFVTAQQDFACIMNAEQAIKNCEKQGGMVKEEKNLTDVDVLDLILGLVVGSIIMLMGAFVMFAGSIMLLIRIIAIWILIVIAPLAFICNVLPSLRIHWEKWRGKFLKWCFFAPIYTFFVWVATEIAQRQAGLQMGMTAAQKYQGMSGTYNIFANEFVVNPGARLIQFFIIGGFLVGGLIAAQQLSIYGAKAAISIGQKWGKGIGRGISKWTGARVREKAAGPIAGLTKGLAKIPGFGRLAKLAQQPMMAQNKAIEEAKKKLPESIETLKILFPRLNPTEQIAAAQKMAEKGKLFAGGNFKEKDINNVIVKASKYEAIGDMLKNRADLAHITKKLGDTNQQAIEKFVAKLNSADAAKLQKEALTSEVLDAIFEHQTGTFIAKIAESNTEAANKIQQAITAKGPDAATRYVEIGSKNLKLADYIFKSAGQGTGAYTFD